MHASHQCPQQTIARFALISLRIIQLAVVRVCVQPAESPRHWQHLPHRRQQPAHNRQSGEEARHDLRQDAVAAPGQWRRHVDAACIAATVAGPQGVSVVLDSQRISRFSSVTNVGRDTSLLVCYFYYYRNVVSLIVILYCPFLWRWNFDLMYWNYILSAWRPLVLVPSSQLRSVYMILGYLFIWWGYLGYVMDSDIYSK